MPSTRAWIDKQCTLELRPATQSRTILHLLSCLELAWLLPAPLGRRFPEPQDLPGSNLRPPEAPRPVKEKYLEEFCMVGILASFGKVHDCGKKANSSALN